MPVAAVWELVWHPNRFQRWDICAFETQLRYQIFFIRRKKSEQKNRLHGSTAPDSSKSFTVKLVYIIGNKHWKTKKKKLIWKQERMIQNVNKKREHWKGDDKRRVDEGCKRKKKNRRIKRNSVEHDEVTCKTNRRTWMALNSGPGGAGDEPNNRAHFWPSQKCRNGQRRTDTFKRRTECQTQK